MEYYIEEDHPYGPSVIDENGRRYGRAMEDDTVNFTEATQSLGQSQYISRYLGGFWELEGYPNLGQGLDITDGQDGPHIIEGHDGQLVPVEYHKMGIGAHHVDTFVGRVAAWKTLRNHEVRDENGYGRSATDAEITAAEKHLFDEGFLLFLK